MRIKYNAPTILTFTFISVLVLLLSQTLFPSLTAQWFAVPGKENFSPRNFRNLANLITHVIGHADWNHLVSNFSLILLLGPMLEENYGSSSMLCMIVITALVTGLLNVFLFPTGLLGASGVVFMMILLSSFTNSNKGEIPLTFILVLVLYVGSEFINSFKEDDISQFAHIAGGFCGSLFGFFRDTRKDKRIQRAEGMENRRRLE
ncbi:MAG: rhomboid family intramembrane serine protease [Spirochaetaceae bacterium]|jgi:membrane associated rhomboid family serine protease|nr:rhomboid family intramembrane serine protease [Spirochaetaceae bacterium]